MGIEYKMENWLINLRWSSSKKEKSKKELLSEGVTPKSAEIDGIPTDIVAVPGGFKPK